VAQLLGFDGVVENSLDANQVIGADTTADFSSAMAISALHVGRFVQDIHIQYHDPNPWMRLHPSLTHPSSIMPQKRNPGPLERTRGIASGVVGDGQAVLLLGHNSSTGMNDHKSDTRRRVLAAAKNAQEMYRGFGVIVGGLVVSPERSLEEVNNDYATMTEVADTLLRHAEIPFRIGHHYASDITTYGKKTGKRPMDLSWEELKEIYRESTGGQELPVAEEQLRASLEPEKMVGNRKGMGGPQADEVERMIGDLKRQLSADRNWLDGRLGKLSESDALLEREFQKLVTAAN
jgi:argininosuccinate lyase